MEDEETGSEPQAVSASITDPYIFVIRNDSSVFVAKIRSTDHELEELDKSGSVLTSTKWKAGCLYEDTQGVFQSSPSADENRAPNVMMFLLSASGALQVFALPDLSKPVYVAEGLSSIPPFLSPKFVGRRGATRESLAELVVADIGDAVDKTPYLIVRKLISFHVIHQYANNSL